MEFPGGTLVLPLGETLFFQHGIIGRGCYVLEAKVENAPTLPIKFGTVCVVKITRLATSRSLDSVIIEGACKLPTTSKDHAWALRHPPKLLHAEIIDPTPTQERLAALFKDYELRATNVLVMGVLFSVQKLTNPANVETVFRHIFHG
jgi:hypothetical protein